MRTSLVVQWLRLHAVQGAQVQSLVRELDAIYCNKKRSHMPQLRLAQKNQLIFKKGLNNFHFYVSTQDK